MHYHSRTFECKDKKNCKIGPLIFLLSEILPVTIVFLLFIFLDINLASGIAGGFVFFAQVYVSLENRSYIFIKNDIPSIITASHHIFYQLFNFDFLETDLLTFCLYYFRRLSLTYQRVWPVFLLEQLIICRLIGII